MRQRGTIFVVLFLLLAAGVIGVSQFLRSQPALEVEVAVSPLAADWVTAAANSFNATEPLANGTRRFRVNIVTVDDVEVWRDSGDVNWTATDHPAAWLPASSVSVAYASERQMPFETIEPSLAQTWLVWGAFASRAPVIEQISQTGIDWQSVAGAVEAQLWSALPGGSSDWQYVKLALPQPAQSMSGFAVLVTGAAGYAGTNVPTAVLSQTGFREWMQGFIESVPNFTTIGADPAAGMAARGPSAGEVALLPESQWLMNLDGLLRNEPMVFSYPAYQFSFDFPLARWNDSTLTDDERSAVTMFANWLTNPDQQASLADYGLRLAGGDVSATAARFLQAEPYGIEPMLIPAQTVTAPSHADAIRLLQWVDSAR